MFLGVRRCPMGDLRTPNFFVYRKKVGVGIPPSDQLRTAALCSERGVRTP